MNASDIVLISVGRLDKNKNNETIIKAIGKCKDSVLHLVLCGDGEERENLSQLSERLNVSEHVHFLGNRKDMVDLYKMADVFVMASYREGLSRSLMEAMASGLPCIVSKIRGNVDLIEENIGGYLVDALDVERFAEKFQFIISNAALRKRMGEANLEKIRKYDVREVKQVICKIYKEVLE